MGKKHPSVRRLCKYFSRLTGQEDYRALDSHFQNPHDEKKVFAATTLERLMKQSEKPATLVREHIVSPAISSAETRWLLLIILAIFICYSIVITTQTRSGAEKQLEVWQLNAFEALNASELAVFNALQIAALEIEQTHHWENGRWLEIEELAELYITPFVKNAAWRKQGQIEWSQKIIPGDDRHIALYRGLPQTEDVRGAFLLLMLHDHEKKQGNVSTGPTHAPFEIWLHKNRDQRFPEIITDQALISTGWQEIVALTGEDEVIRMKGTAIP